jgi:hypothetical protein
MMRAQCLCLVFQYIIIINMLCHITLPIPSASASVSPSAAVSPTYHLQPHVYPKSKDDSNGHHGYSPSKWVIIVAVVMATTLIMTPVVIIARHFLKGRQSSSSTTQLDMSAPPRFDTPNSISSF